MYVLKTGFTLVNIGCIKQKPGNSDYNFGRVANENVARHKTNQPSPPSLDPQNHMTLSLNWNACCSAQMPHPPRLHKPNAAIIWKN